MLDMRVETEQTRTEAKQLRSCINDLMGVVALPAIWSGSTPSEIVRTLLDALLGTLRLDFVYLRLKDSIGEPPIEAVRAANRHAETIVSQQIPQLLRDWPGTRIEELPRVIRNVPGGEDFYVIPLPLGLAGEIGILVAGSLRADFPSQTERLLLTVAANQTAVWLQGARLLGEQKRVAGELDRRVAQRTEELAAANKELRTEIAKQQSMFLENARLYHDLEDRERRIRRLIDSNIIGIVIWDLDGRLIDANDAFLRMVGYDREDVKAGIRWFDMTPPEWQEAHARYEAEELKATGMMQAREKEYFRKDGSRVPVLIGAACFEDRPSQGVAYIVDLSKQKLAEEALRRSEAYLTEAQRLTHTGSCAIDGTSRETVYWSDEMFRLFGFDPQEGPPKWDRFLEQIHPDDRDKVKSANERTFRIKTSCDVEFRTLQPDGTVKHIHGIGHPVLSATGELVQLLGTMVDVTDLKRADEERERLIQAHRVVVETASDAVITADERGAIQFANPATTRVFGYDPMELIGKPLTILMPEVMRDLHNNGFRRYLATGQRHINWQGTELTGLRKNGKEFPIEVSFGEMTIDGRRIFTGFIRDITERKQAEGERERLRRVQADLAHVTRVSSMGELTASLAHEIKQPIGAAVTNAEACLRLVDRLEPDLPEAREAAVEMIKDARRAAEIIDRVRSVFQKGSSHLETVDLNQVIEEMVVMMGVEATRLAVTIRTDLASELPAVMADRVQLQQALMNLMLNGTEAMRDTPGELSIKSQLSENGQVLISVSDSGIGLPAEGVEQIFNAFFTTKSHGTGLGLAITRSIVESHGGRIWASANSGPGATFQFTLPTAEGDGR